MTERELHDYLMTYPETRLEYPFGENVAVYKTGAGNDAKMFAIIAEGSKPTRISLKCDPQLAEILREKYETVLPGHHLNKKHWNTVLCTGQVDDDELQSFIRHSFELVAASN